MVIRPPGGHTRIRSARGSAIQYAVALVSATLGYCLGCGDGPVSPLRAQTVVDLVPGWSHSGALIAFARAESTSSGPPGIYVLGYPAGTPQLVLELNPGDLACLHFSPDDKELAAFLYGSLVRINIANRSLGYFQVNTSAAAFPDWANLGQKIAYVRPLSVRGTLWVYDLETFQDTALHADSTVLYGTYPRWDPGDSLFVFSENAGLSIMPTAGGLKTRLTSSAPGEFHDVPRWLDRERILYNVVTTHETRHRIVHRITGAQQDVPSGLGSSEAISPTGDSIVVQAVDRRSPHSGRLVLFIRPIAGPTSAGRQITFP